MFFRFTYATHHTTQLLRLPRRYSNDKNRDASAPIVGTSGSTPLHFAAANGNTNVVTTLLLHGAHPNRPDKHGITPEMLARQHGWLECAEVLRTWVLNKDRDLRERPAPVDSNIPANRSGRERLGSFGSVGEASVSGSSTRRRLQVKQSIDTALNMLKPSSTGLSDAYLKPPQPSSSGNFPSSSTPPASPGKPFGEYTFIPTSPSDDGRHSPNSSPIDPDTRRPSLPHILAPPVRDRKTSIPAITGGSPRRPRSAGTGAEEIQEQESASTPWGKNSTGRRLASKYSLLNLFKKAQAGEPEGPSAGHKPSQSIATASSSPALGSTSNLPLSSSPKFFTLGHNNHSTPVSHDNTGQSANIPSSTSGSPFSRAGFRFHRGSDASTRARPPSQQPLSSTPPQPTISLAVDLHNAIAQQQQQHRQQVRYRSRSGSRSRVDSNGLGSDDNIVTSSSFSNGSPLAGLGYIASRRDRSGSGASIAGSTNMPNRSGAVFDDDVLVAPSTSGESAKAGARPSILRAHTRSSSIGQNVGAPLGFRALRFDSTSSGSSGEKRVRDGDGSPANGGAALRSSNSAGSLVKFKLRNGTDAGRRPESAGSSGVAKASEDLDHVYETAHGPEESEHADEGQVLGDDDDDDGEDDYGRPIYRPESTPADIPATDAKVRGPLLLSERGLSLNSSHSSLSPILSNDGATVTSATVNADFPFSINRPPMLLDDQETPLSQSPELLRVPSPLDNRGRGDSISSTSTTDSRGNPSLSVSGTTSGSGGSMTVTTPLLSPGRDSQFGPSADSSPRSKDEEFLDASSDLEQAQIDRYVDGVRISPTSGLGSGERRVRAPLDINISSISSHAQAEALVQRAQQDILEMAHVMEVSPLVDGTAGRTPLSAKLAAYGESLALERRLREQEAAAREAKTDEMRPRSGTPISTHEGLGSGVDQRRERVERQHSLGNKTTTSRSRTKEPRRPSTAEGRE